MDCEVLLIELTLATNKLLIVVFYNDPGSNTNALIQVHNSLANVNNSTSVILYGDFNLSCISWSQTGPLPSATYMESTLFCDIINDFQLVSEPTRGSNILDH